MKHFFPNFNLFLLGMLAMELLVWGCTGINSQKFVSKTDTVNILYRYPSNSGLQYSRGIYKTILGRKFEDSTSLNAKASIDTAWTIYVPDASDTVRDANHKPIYDSANKTYRFNSKWYKLSDQENKNVKVQIISI